MNDRIKKLAVEKVLCNRNMIYLEWEDSAGVDGGPWIDTNDIPPKMLCQSCGFVAKETGSTITIAGHKASTGQYSGVLTIPKSAIRKRRIVRVKP